MPVQNFMAINKIDVDISVKKAKVVDRLADIAIFSQTAKHG